jgi:predicted PurR-regulated permease PerM
MKNNENSIPPVRTAIEIFIRLALLILLIAWCFQILYPFSSVILWGFILALALAPIYNTINARLHDSPKWTATLIIVLGLLVLILPSWWLIDSAIHGAKELHSHLEAGTLTIPPPAEKVKEWPLFGEKTFNMWKMASENMDDFTTKYSDQILNFGLSFVDSVLNVATTIMQFALAVIIAGILLATKGTEDISKKIFRKLIGERGDSIAELAESTVGNVTKGVLGVAVIQSLLIGLGFLLAGVPYAGIWAIVVFLLAVLQLPPTLLVIPIIVYLFSIMGTFPAVLWSIYLLLASVSDNVLKPILLGKGAPVPMLVIFLGVVGGFMFSGFIGLFTGAIVLSLGYRLFIFWLDGEGDSSKVDIETG